MGKIKLNLVSGAIVEKPLITAFKANNLTYVVLDNEMNGSMGLPIILVCKYDNNKLIKIADQNEWQIVKEYLKNIIAGGQIEYVSIPNEMSADDIYYTQLTLPVPSFDALKNSYKTIEEVNNTPTSEPTAGIMDINPNMMGTPTIDKASQTDAPAPAVNAAPSMESTPQDVINPVASQPINNQPISPIDPTEPISPAGPIEPTPSPVMPEVPNVTTQPEPTPISEPVVPNPQAPAVDIGIPTSPVNEVATPVTNSAPAIDLNTPMPTVEPPKVVAEPTNETVVPTSPVMPSAPVVEDVNPTPSVSEVSPFKDQKEAFMQACENMFDALVQKFEKELENRK